MIETAVAQALRIHTERPERQRRLSVFQSRGKGDAVDGEIDFVVEDGDRTIAIEVTRHHGDKKHPKLVRAGRELGASWLGVVSLTQERSESVSVDGDVVHRLPLAEFLLELAEGRGEWPW